MKISHRIDGRLGNVLSEIFLLFWFCRQHNIDFSRIVLNKDKHNYGEELDDKKREFFSFSISKYSDFFSNIKEHLISEQEFRNIFNDSFTASFQLFKQDIIEPEKNILVTDFCPMQFGVDIFNDASALSLYKQLFFNKEYIEQVLQRYNYSKFTLGVSVRRGDFLTFHDGKFKKFVKTADEYLEIIKNEDYAQLIVFSDDIEWCKQNFSILQGENTVFHENISAAEDLILLSKCQRIIANKESTFSIHAKIFQMLFYNTYNCKLI